MSNDITIESSTVSLYDIERAITPAQLSDLIVAFLNGRSAHGLASALAEKLCREHRTLQHVTVDFLIGSLAEYAKRYAQVWNNHTDARNEGAVRAAGKVKALVDDGKLDTGWLI